MCPFDHMAMLALHTVRAQITTGSCYVVDASKCQAETGSQVSETQNTEW